MIKKISLNRVIFIFFFTVVVITFGVTYIQYNNSKKIFIKSYINKYSFESLQIKEKFKSVFDKALFVFKSHDEENIKKLYTLPLFYQNGHIDVDKVAKVFNADLREGHYEIFVINRNFIITEGTYKPDIGYNLGKFPAFRKVLEDVFDGKKDIDVSYIHMDIASKNLKKYYLIRSPDGKYLLQLAYVVNIYPELKKIYDFIRPSLSCLQLFFVDRYMMYKINMKHRFQKKEPVLTIYKNSFKILKDIKECDNKKFKSINLDRKNIILFNKVVKLFEHNNNILTKLDMKKNELIIYTMLNSVFNQMDNKIIVKTVYNVKTLKSDLSKLTNTLILSLVTMVMFFIFLYFLIIYRASRTIIDLVKHMKLNKPCNNCESFIKEIDGLKTSYNNLHCKLNKEIEKNKNLLDLNRRFIVDTIHQIRTPLNVIMLNMDLLKLEVKHKGVEDLIEEIDAAVAMLTNSYEDLAYLSSNNKAITYKPETVNISSILISRINFFMTIAKVNDKKFKVNVDKNIYFRINRIEFERIVDNNISNAIKYSTEEKILISLKKHKNIIVLKIASYADPIKEPGKIFEKNYREKTHKRGLGLGLNIVKNICDKYGIIYNVYYSDGMNVFEYILKT